MANVSGGRTATVLITTKLQRWSNMTQVCPLQVSAFMTSAEIAAVQALLEEVPVAGRVITVDALHTVRQTARCIVEIHKADYLMTVKANAPETFATLSSINWERMQPGHTRRNTQRRMAASNVAAS